MLFKLFQSNYNLNITKIHRIIMFMRSIFYRFFITEAHLQPMMQLLSQVIENIVYVLIINKINFSQALTVFSQDSLILLQLVLLCLVKYCFKVSLRFGITLLLLQIIINNKNGPWMVINSLILLLFSISQLIGCITFDFSSESVQSQSRIQNKGFRYCLLFLNVCLTTALQNYVYVHLASSLLFVVLLINKRRSLIKNQTYREIEQRFYIWAGCEHLRLFLATFSSLAMSNGAIFLSIIISQIIFSLLQRFKGNESLHELLAKGQNLKIAFLLLRCIHSSGYDHQMQKFIQLFNQQTIENIGLSKIKKNDEQNLGKYNSKQIISNKDFYRAVSTYVDKSDGFLQAILRAEIYLKQGKTLVALQTLCKARKRLGNFSWLSKIILIRSQQRIKLSFQRLSQKVIFTYYKQWKSYLDFQSLIYRATVQHLKFNSYLRKEVIDLSKIKKMCRKVINFDTDVVKKFQEVRNVFAVSTQLFVTYLVKVRDDVANAEAVLSRQRLRENHLLDFSCDQKIYLKVGINEEGLLIEKIGYNSQALLGYKRSELQGQLIQKLVPSFFRNDHQRVSSAFIRHSFKQAMLFNKKSIILNNRQSYSACVISLKLCCGQVFSEQGFYFQGYIKVSSNEKHDLGTGFMVNQNGIILQINFEILKHDTNCKSMKLQQFFYGLVGQKLTRLSKQNNNEQIFDPIMYFEAVQPFYFYAKRITDIYDIPIAQGSNLSNLTQMAAPLLKQKKQSMRQFIDRQDEIQNKIRSKQLNIIYALILIFIFGLFGSEGLLILSANVKYGNQSFAVANFRMLIKYFNATKTANLNFVYIDLRDTYNYSNTFTTLSLAQSALRIQTVNEYMKGFNMGKYRLTTYNPNISYQLSNFELQIMLSANAYLYQLFIDDPYMRNAVMDQTKLVTPVITLQSFSDYRIALFNLMTNFVEMDIYYQQLSFWTTLANTLLFIILGVRLFWKLRQIEQYALEKRCQGSFYHKKIKSILKFMKEMALEQVTIDKMNQQIYVYDTLTKTQQNSNNNNNTYMLSEASLIKDGNTVRNIMNDSLNKTGFIEDLERIQNNIKPQNKQHIFKKPNSHRQILVIFSIFILILIGLNVTNEIINYKIKNVDEVTSLNSILAIYRTAGFYSSRGVISTLNTMIVKNQKGRDNSAGYTNTINSLYSFLATFTLPVFRQASFKEFSQFSYNLSQLYQDPICTFMPCLPQYQNEINLNFITVINKYSANLSSMVRATWNFTIPQLATYLKTNKRYIDMLFYSEKILRTYVADLMMLYLDSYNQYMINLYNDKWAYIGVMIILTAFALIIFGFFVLKMQKQHHIFIKMIKIYREPVTEE